MTAPRRARAFAALALLLGLGAAAPDLRDQLRDADRAKAANEAAARAARDRAAAATQDEQRLTRQRVEAAAALSSAEERLADASAEVDALARRRTVAEAELAKRAAAIAPLLPLAQRLALYPAETLLAMPLPAEDAVRGAIVLGGLARTLEAQAAAVRAEQAEVEALSAKLAAAMPGLEAAQAEQARLANALDTSIAETRAQRDAAEDAASDASRQAAAAAARADSLRDAIARIDAERRAAEARAREQAIAAERKRQADEARAARARQAALATPAGPGIGEPRRALGTPVAGRVVARFGDQTESGPAQGMSFATPSGARVTAPCSGRVAFAAPFRSYGQLAIIDCGGGYHFVLSGLARLDARAGQPIAAGEPVGVMAAWEPGSGSAAPVLQLELRKDGGPVDPAPFLRTGAQGSKLSG